MARAQKGPLGADYREEDHEALVDLAGGQVPAGDRELAGDRVPAVDLNPAEMLLEVLA